MLGKHSVDFLNKLSQMLELESKLVSFLSYIFNVNFLNIIIVSLLLNSCYVHFIIVAISISSYHVPHMYCLLYFHYFHSLPSSNMVLLREYDKNRNVVEPKNPREMYELWTHYIENVKWENESVD